MKIHTTFVRATRSLRHLVWMLLAVPLACATPATPKTALPPGLVSAMAHPAPIDRYLAKVEQQLTGRWGITVADLRDLRRKRKTTIQQPVADAPLVTVVEVALNAHGTLADTRVARRSGWHLFDYHAKLLLGRVKWPTPPRVGEKRLVLRWAFFDDGRGCARRFASVSTRRLGGRAALARALAKGDTARALRLVKSAGGADAVAAIVERALKDHRPAVQRLALRLVTPATLERRLLDHRGALGEWRATLAEVRRRGAKAAVQKAIARLGRPLYSWRPAVAAERHAQDVRLAALLPAAKAAKVAVPKGVVIRALASPLAQTRRAAMPLCHDVAQLLRAMQRGTDHDRRLGLQTLFVTLSRLKATTKAAQRGVAFLQGVLRGSNVALRRAALEATARWPLLALRATIVALPRQLPALDRAQRLRALARFGDIMVLYRHLKASQAPVRLAALEELGRFPGAGLGASYRLSTQAYHAPEPFRSTAIVALVRIGHPRMAKDIEFLLRRLPKATKRVVAPRLATLGARGRAALKLLGVAGRPAPKAPAPTPTLSKSAVLQRLVQALAVTPPTAGKERAAAKRKGALVSHVQR